MSVTPTDTLVAFIGEFDESNVHEVAATVPIGDHRSLVIDLAGVTFCSSVFVGKLISLHQAVLADGGKFRLSAVSSVVARVLEIAGIAAALGAPGH